MLKARTGPIAYQSVLKDVTMDDVLLPINVNVSQDLEERRAQNVRMYRKFLLLLLRVQRKDST